MIGDPQEGEALRGRECSEVGETAPGLGPASDRVVGEAGLLRLSNRVVFRLLRTKSLSGRCRAATAVQYVVLCKAMFLRTEGREPRLAASVLGGLATGTVVWLVARHGTSGDIGIANLICSFGGIPVVFNLLRTRERVWQASTKTGGKV